MCLALLHACWGQVTGKAAIQASAKSSVKIVRKLNFTAHKEASAQWGAGVHEMISHILDNEVSGRPCVSVIMRLHAVDWPCQSKEDQQCACTVQVTIQAQIEAAVDDMHDFEINHTEKARPPAQRSLPHMCAYPRARMHPRTHAACTREHGADAG